MCSGHARIFWRTLILIVFGSVLVPRAFAGAQWNGGISFAPSILYSDNVCLSNSNKQSQWVGVGLITPSGSVSGRGARTNFEAGGSVQFNTLTNSQLKDDNCQGGYNNDREQYAPNLYARGSATIAENWFKIDTNSRSGQNQVNPYRGGGNDSLNRNGNINNYYVYSVSPVVSGRLKNDFAKGSLRYSYEERINSQDSLSDSASNVLTANVDNDQRSQVTWNLKGNYRNVEYDDYVNFTGVPVTRQDSELKNLSLGLRYQIDRRWQINGRYGWEWNDYQTYNSANTGGGAWDFGFLWTPTARTSVSVGFTDRFFGKTPRLNISHTRKRSVFTATYSKKITFGNDIRDEQDIYNPDYIYNDSLDSNSPIIEERFTLGYSYTGRRANIDVSGNYSHQTEEDNGEKTVFKGLALTFSPLISSVYTLSGTIAWNENEQQEIFGVDSSKFLESSSTWITNVRLGRQLNDHLSLSLDYQFTDNQSRDSINEYQENRVMATFTFYL